MNTIVGYCCTKFQCVLLSFVSPQFVCYFLLSCNGTLIRGEKKSLWFSERLKLSGVRALSMVKFTTNVFI